MFERHFNVANCALFVLRQQSMYRMCLGGGEYYALFGGKGRPLSNMEDGVVIVRTGFVNFIWKGKEHCIIIGNSMEAYSFIEGYFRAPHA